MIDQLSLLDGHARDTDPATSHAAVPDNIRLSRQCVRVLDAVHTLHHQHGNGATAWDVTEFLNDGTQRSVVARRLTDLRDRGLIRCCGWRPGPAGRNENVWIVVRNPTEGQHT